MQLRTVTLPMSHSSHLQSGSHTNKLNVDYYTPTHCPTHLDLSSPSRYWLPADRSSTTSSWLEKAAMESVYAHRSRVVAAVMVRWLRSTSVDLVSCGSAGTQASLRAQRTTRCAGTVREHILTAMSLREHCNSRSRPSNAPPLPPSLRTCTAPVRAGLPRS